MYVICDHHHCKQQLHKAYYVLSTVLSTLGRWTKLTWVKKKKNGSSQKPMELHILLIYKLTGSDEVIC